MAKKTQPGIGGLPGRRYGNFVGKEEYIVVDWVRIQAADGDWKKVQDN